MASSVAGGKLGIIIHICGGVLFAYTWYEDDKLVSTHRGYGGRWKFLTVLNLMCQLIYFIIAPLADVLTLIKGHEDNWLVKLRDTVFSALAFPLGVFVAATFWGIYMIDRELIFPSVLDKIIPPWLNHLLHTWCAVFMIVEGAFIRHKYPKNRVGLGLLALFAATYLIWIMWVAYAAEFWVYPFLRIMSNPARAAFFVVCACILAFFYFLGKWMTLSIWRVEEERKSTSTKSKEGAKKKVKKAD
ncbi:androgen-induced gene 1 protein-like isoform X1 [Oculina patagonica]